MGSPHRYCSPPYRGSPRPVASAAGESLRIPQTDDERLSRTKAVTGRCDEEVSRVRGGTTPDCGRDQAGHAVFHSPRSASRAACSPARSETGKSPEDRSNSFRGAFQQYVYGNRTIGDVRPRSTIRHAISTRFGDRGPRKAGDIHQGYICGLLGTWHTRGSINMSYRVKLLVVFIALALVTNGISLAFMYRLSSHYLYDGYRAKLLSITVSTAAVLDGDVLQQIQSRADEATPAYAQVR